MSSEGASSLTPNTPILNYTPNKMSNIDHDSNQNNTFINNTKKSKRTTEYDEKLTSTQNTIQRNFSNDEINDYCSSSSQQLFSKEIVTLSRKNSGGIKNKSVQKQNFQTSSNLVSKFLCIKKYQSQNEKFIVCKHIPLTFKLYFPSMVTFGCLIFTIFSSNYLLIKFVKKNKKLIFMISFNYFALLGIISYLRTLITNPGFVPISYFANKCQNPEKLYDFPIGKIQHQYYHDQERPPRSRYSETFHSLIFKADHICYLVGNFIGLKNYKFFILSLFYFTIESILSLIIIFNYLFSIEKLHYLLLAIITGIISLVFGAFLLRTLIIHIQLISKNTTWLESQQINDRKKKGQIKENIYDLGCYKNYKQVLGKDLIFWFFPINIGLDNDGFVYETNL
ncbi:palmitoyltransferase [Anaeramoeba flamelloides]|uniref:Palmitoyltransferase n=1 Tax=Anaeramoeba flamelloides TaxID=1746091 RepID=A0ABQ8X6T9_9EUKA|nr:palmitoyltransferase [Anaeramoeba flamelloides]